MSALDARIARIAGQRARGELGFRAAVYAMVRLIPAGQVLGYGHVAALLGSPRAARQVGYALAALSPDAADPHGEAPVPWWRVIRSDGSIAQAGDPARPLHQRRLLQDEGVPVEGERVSMERHQWRPA